MSLADSSFADQPLADRACVPCRGGVLPLKGDALQTLGAELPDWNVRDDHDLFRVYKFADFQTALDFVNRVGAVAEEQGHHPDLLLSWGKVEITIFTHSIDGLAESDFVLAAKIERLHRN